MRPSFATSVRRRFGALIVGVTMLAGCSGDASLPPAVEAETPTTVATESPTQRACDTEQLALDATRSYEPTEPLPTPREMPEGSQMQRIFLDGRLTVGVSGDTLQFGARDPISGDIEGFDVDILKEVAKAIFGDVDPLPIEYKVITYAQRLPSLESGSVDLVAHTMTINCNRWLRIAFSTEYYHAGQKILVKNDSDVTDVKQLVDSGALVCVPSASTNLDEMQNKYPDVQLVERADITDCLVDFQQGQADAITADDTVLVGFAAQDPYAKVVGEPFTDEPYGIGVRLNQADLVRFVNGVLDNIRANGRWDEIHAKWVGGDPVEPPAALYGRSPEESG